MPSSRIVVDGLWRCLCPSVDTAALLRAVNRPTAAAPRARPPPARSLRSACAPLSAGVRQGCAAAPVRRIYSAARGRVGRLGLVGGSGAARGAGASSLGDQTPWVTLLLRSRPPYRRDLDAAPTAAIYAALRRLQDAPAAYDRIEAYVRYLVEERQERPTVAMYEALVRANCHTSGSAEAVRDVLQALKAAKLEATPSLYHGALSALAVHPDYLLRNAILQEMKERWIDLTPDGRQSVALGLLRDGQYERAVEQLEAMTEGDAATADVPPWLLDMFIYVLGQEGFVDDALRIVNYRLLKASDGVSANVWFFLLDTCGRLGHYSGLCYVWRRAVRPGRLTPSDAMALDALNAAARHGDAALAAEVMQMLSARGTKLGMAHFEAMLECYASAGDVGHALQALCIMQHAGITPDQGSTRAIYQHLVGQTDTAQVQTPAQIQRRIQAALDDAVRALFDLKTKYGGVPAAAFNVVLEATLYQPVLAATTTTTSAEDAALDLYRHVRQLVPAGPDRTTFRMLFRGCGEVQHLNFLYREMRALGLAADAETVDRLVHENAVAGSRDVALEHVYRLMQETPATATVDLWARPWISRRTAAALVQRCVDDGDARITEVAEASRARGRPMDAILQEAVRGRPLQAPPNAYGVPHAIHLDDEASPDS